MQGAKRALRAGARFQSTAAANTAAVASGASAAVAQSSAIKIPVLTSQEQRARGNNVSDPAARFALQDTSYVDVTEARKVATLSSRGEDTVGRTVIIYKPSQHALTSGVAASKHWAVRANNVDKWSNQLMGWVSSTDTFQTPLSVNKFESVEQAILFCERNGFQYEVQEHREKTAIASNPRSPGNQYSYNFLSLETQANMKRAGARKARHIFTHPDSPAKAGVSTWVNYRKTDFGPDAWRPRTDIGQGKTAWQGPDWAPSKVAGH